MRLFRPDGPVTAMRWAIEPAGLTEVLLRLHREHPGLPLYVHENGAAFDDPPPDESGLVPDADRIEFLRAHLDACLDAIAAEAPLRGYFVWTLLDNFEWAHGYERRFGIVGVDAGTLDRRPKASATWYADYVRAHR